MARAKSKSPKVPVISVPTPEQERFHLGKVGIMAVVGLSIGIVWPRFAGFHLVPAPPSESVASPSADAGAASASGSASAPGAAPIAGTAAAKAPAGDPSPSGVTPPKVTLAQVVSCRSKDAGKKAHCDTPAIDSVVGDPLRALIACDGAEGTRGILSLGFDVDFENNKLDNYTAGKSTTLPSSLTKQLLRCAEKELGKVSLEGVTHPMMSYRVFYRLEFGAEPGEAAASKDDKPSGDSPAPSGEVIAASGRVTVTWDAALVRAKPKDGEILARVLGGTRLTVTGHQGDWYRVKYDAKGSEGWVFKAAIGL